MLADGGNAFDAAVAAGFAAAVAEPLLTGLGGGGFLLARTPDGASVVHDFFVDTPGRGLGHQPVPHFHPVTIQFPGSTQDFNVGRGSAAVPGCLAGYVDVHRRRGRLPLSDVVAPAIALGRAGITLDGFQASVIGLLWPILVTNPDSRRWYGRDGAPRRAGDTVSNPELADFMEAAAAEPAVTLYEGAVATQIAADMEAGDGLITEEDLAAYEPIDRTPLAIQFRDRIIMTNPLPAFGGTLVALGLQLVGQLSPDVGLVERTQCLVDVEEIRDAGQVLDRLRPAGDVSPAAKLDVAREGRQSTGGTTHVSVADADGNVASMTTSNGENSGYVVPGTGVMLNNMLGEDDLHPDGFHGAPPGERVSSMMSPMIVVRDGEVEAVLGSGGSKRIRSALIQVVTSLVDDGLDARAAVEHPRVHWDGDVLQVEPGLGATVDEALADRWPVNRWAETNMYFGGPHVVRPGLDEAGDPRRGGSALTV